MIGLNAFFVSVLFYTSYAQVESGYQPMVAFMCNYPAMYLTESGWITDEETDCVDDAEDVLDYCKKMFPTLDVRNVVESSQLSVIENWCRVGEESCERALAVRPFRCLVGPFQSDALLVPAGCVFDHIHLSHVCKSYSEWNTTAIQSCSVHNYTAQSFAVLQPCEGTVSQFDGVEFVCCPRSFEMVKSSEVPPTMSTLASVLGEPSVLQVDSSIAYNSYLHSSRPASTLSEEHAAFAAAKADLHKQQQAAHEMLAEDWTRVRQRIAMLNISDPQGAEKMEHEASARFQQAIKALDNDSRADRLQLDAKHQSRVETILNDQKRKALQSYHQAVAEQKQDMEKVLHTLKQYIRTEMKDRQHITNRYHHLLQTDPELLKSEKHLMRKKLIAISQNIQQAVNLLEQVRADQPKLRLETDNFMATFSQLDRSAAFILADDDAPATENVHMPRMQVHSDTAEQDIDDADVRPDDDINALSSVDHGKDAESDVADSKQEDKTKDAELDVNGDDDEEVEDESDDSIPQIEHGDHLSDSELDQEEALPFVRPHVERRNMSTSAIVVTIGGCAVLTSLVLSAVVMLYRRFYRSIPRGPAFSSLSQSMPLEDIHITNMQMTGYENPTYRFFEEKGSSSA